MDKTLFLVALARKQIPAIVLARRLGVHHSTLSTWVNAHYSVPEKYRTKLAEELEVKVEELFPPSSDPP